jgi:CubicO group peptidase (beta-lactamase class C family)
MDIASLNTATKLLNSALADHAFPGASVAVTHHHKLVLSEGIGRFTYQPDSPILTAETTFDLASLTKVVATTAAAMVLFERGQFALDQRVAEVVPEFAEGEDSRKKQITFRMLLAHSSGLPAHVRFFEQVKTKQDLLRAAFAVPLESPPMTRAEYSDIGFIILGVALERIAKQPLDHFCALEIFQPLGMLDTGFRPAKERRRFIPPTLAAVDFRSRVIQGEVHDENASVMGGVAGHAGLFAPATDVAKFAGCMLRGGDPILKPATIKLFSTREQLPSGTTRALGWDTPSSPSQSGKYFSSHSFGHLGYTGTSLWIDPERELSITLLTNRTWPDNSSQAIKQVRPAVHDAIIQELG